MDRLSGEGNRVMRDRGGRQEIGRRRVVQLHLGLRLLASGRARSSCFGRDRRRGIPARGGREPSEREEAGRETQDACDTAAGLCPWCAPCRGGGAQGFSNKDLSSRLGGLKAGRPHHFAAMIMRDLRAMPKAVLIAFPSPAIVWHCRLRQSRTDPRQPNRRRR